jgi:hypothetical protein
MKQSKMIARVLLLLTGTPLFANTQPAKTSSTMQQVTVTKTGGLVITPTATSSATDFDFLEGKWSVHNRKLKARLAGNDEWSTFESTLHMRKTLNGTGNVENYYASFDGKPFEGQAVRLFNKETRLWTIYWMDSNNPVMDEHPVTGSFEKGVGKFYARDVFNGKPIVVIYQWDATDPAHPKWSQAFSEDEGKTWEWNWEMTLTRID